MPVISWKKLGGKIPQNAWEEANGKLVFGEIKMKDSGAYSCTATNSVGSNEATVTIIVQGLY